MEIQLLILTPAAFFYIFFPLFWCHQIESYMMNTHAKLHSDYTVEIVQIFRTSKEGEAERFRKVWLMNFWIRIYLVEIYNSEYNCWHFEFEFSWQLFDFVRQFSNTKNRMLLWHGSRLTSWTGILSQGHSFAHLFGSFLICMSLHMEYRPYIASCNNICL